MGNEIVDNNVFVYAVDADAGQKHQQAIDLVRRLADEGCLAVSVQVLNEFYVTATRPQRGPGLSHAEAQEYIDSLISSGTVYSLETSSTLRALDAVAQYKMHFWDALIWAVAKENGVAVIYTEDVPSADVIEGVRYINPFVLKE